MTRPTLLLIGLMGSFTLTTGCEDSEALYGGEIQYDTGLEQFARGPSELPIQNDLIDADDGNDGPRTSLDPALRRKAIAQVLNGSDSQREGMDFAEQRESFQENTVTGDSLRDAYNLDGQLEAVQQVYEAADRTLPDLSVDELYDTGNL